MKKVLCIALTLAMVFSLAACGSAGNAASEAKSQAAAAVSEAKSAAAAAVSEAKSEAAAAVSEAKSEAAAAVSEAKSEAAAAVSEVKEEAEAALGEVTWNPDNIGEHKFVLAHGLPETGMTGVQYHQFALAVEELSGGKMIVEEKIGGTLLADTETLDAVMDGTIDFCHSMGSYVSGTITDLSPLTVAGYYAGDDWKGFVKDTHDLIESIYADYGIKYLGALYQNNSAIVCTDKQIKSPSDVKGLTFRASGTWISKTVEAWGGAATTIGLADLADAFQKKTVSGTATGYNIIVPFKLYEVAKYVTETTISEGFAALLMNGDTWNSLNEDEQKLIQAAGDIFQDKSFEIGTQFGDEYIKTIEESGMNEIYKLSDEEQKEFQQLAFGLFDQMIDEAGLGEKGIKLIEELKKINGIQ